TPSVPVNELAAANVQYRTKRVIYPRTSRNSPMARGKPDRRTARTQQSLHRSLNTLILEKGYEATTIQDIVTRANVGRSTFYAHHGSKEGLLLHGLQP